MIQDYENSAALIQSTEPDRAEYLDQKDLDILTYQYISPTVDTDFSRKIELHVYDLTGNKMLSMHNISSQNVPIYATATNAKHSYIDVHSIMTEVGFLSGKYKLFFNFLQDLVGSYNTDHLVISQISPSRREIRLKPQYQDGQNLNQNFINQVPNLEGINEYCILLNFGNNDILQAVNWAVEKGPTGQPESILIKLYKPLPIKYDLLSKCWVVGEVSLPYVDTVNLVGEGIIGFGNNIKGPNFDIDIDFQLNQGTNGYKTWNDLLGTGLQTSQQIIDSYFSGSLQGMKLNICYCEFDSFVHFSSAEERLKNFKYKLQLIEQYDQRLNDLSSTIGSVGDNTFVTTRKRNEVISGFDDFENYLYFQSGSLKYTFESCSIDPWPKHDTTIYNPVTWVQASQQWNQMNGQWIQGAPAGGIYPPEKPYVLYNTTSSIAKSYYNNLIASASIYDRFNDHALIKAVPLHIAENDANSNALTFVNMMGHHFDILWTYVNYLNQIIYRKENPADCDAMSCDMLYHVADSMGWKLTHGKLNSDLWEYTLGTNEAGVAQTTGSMHSMSTKDITCELWRRIVNNLPELLKTKGTSRSIKALLACYGIPQTLLSIKEYGGPKPSLSDTPPVFIKDTFNYALEFNGGTKYITSPWDKVKINSYRTPDTIELRFRTRDSKKNYVTTRQTLLQASSSNPPFFVTLERSGSSQKGNAHFYLSGSAGYYTASIQNEYLFDGNWANMMIRRKPTLTYQTSSDNINQENTYTLFVKKHKWGKLTTNSSASIVIPGSVSSSYNQAWQSGSTLYVGYGNNPDNAIYFSGSLQELRYWTKPLDEEDFDNHVTSPSAYDGNTITSSFDDLKFRIPMMEKMNLTATQSLMSQHPNQNLLRFTSSIVASASFHYFTGSLDWNGFDERYYIENPSLGGNNLWSEKVRLESSTLRGYLSPHRSVEISSYDTAPVDSNKLGVYFSPQNSINEDIFNQLGFFEIDDYIGDPRDEMKSSYPRLKNLAYQYWKKYSDRNDFNEYLQIIYQYDLSFFKQLQQLIPARVDLMDGILIEPNVLERSKESLYQRPVVEELVHDAIFGRIEEPTLSGNYLNHFAEIPKFTQSITGSFRQDIGEIDLKIYEPTTYCYTGSDGSYVEMSGAHPTSKCEIFSPIVSQSRLYCNANIISGMSSSLTTGTVKVYFLQDHLYYVTDWKSATGATSYIPGEAWYNASNIYSEDDQYAENRFAGAYGDPSQLSRTLVGFNYGHTIPSSAIITGIEARVKRKASAAESDPAIIPGQYSASYIGVTDLTASIGKSYSGASTILGTTNHARLPVHVIGRPYIPDVDPVPFAVSNSISQSMGTSSIRIQTGWNESSSSYPTPTWTSASVDGQFHDFANYVSATGNPASWSFNGTMCLGYYNNGAAYVLTNEVSHVTNLYVSTSYGYEELGHSGATYAQFTPVSRSQFDRTIDNTFNICDPLVVRDFGFQIGSYTAVPAYSDSGSWVIDGIKIEIRRAAFNNDDDSLGGTSISEVYDSYIQDPVSSAVGGIFPFTGSGTNNYVFQAANWGLAKGDRQRHTSVWPRVSLSSYTPNGHVAGDVNGITNWETKIYPTASVSQSTYLWKRDWTAQEINSSSFAVGVRPAYRFNDDQGGVGVPNYIASALVDCMRITVFAHSASVSQSVLIPGQSGISGSVTNTWLTQSQFVTFGGNGDKWGQTWNPAEVTSSDFAFHYKIHLPSGSAAYTNNVNTGSIDTVETKIYYKVTSSFPCSDIQEFLPEGMNNLKYKGCKMTSADWNIDSPDTVDGTPVVSVYAANPYKFIVQPPGASGSITILGAPSTPMGPSLA